MRSLVLREYAETPSQAFEHNVVRKEVSCDEGVIRNMLRMMPLAARLVYGQPVKMFALRGSEYS